MWVGMFGLLMPLIRASLQQRMRRSSKRKKFEFFSKNMDLSLWRTILSVFGLSLKKNEEKNIYNDFCQGHNSDLKLFSTH